MPTCSGPLNTDDMMQIDDSPMQTTAISKSQRKRIQCQRSKIRAQNYFQKRTQAANIIARAARVLIIRQRHARDIADKFWTSVDAIFKEYSDEEEQFQMFQILVDCHLQLRAELHPDTQSESENRYDDIDTARPTHASCYSIANDECMQMQPPLHEACQGDVIINIHQLPNNSVDCDGNGDISDAGDHHSFRGYSSDNHSDYGDSENNSQYSRSDHDDPDHYSLRDHSYHDHPDQYSSCDYSDHSYSDYGDPDDYDSYQYSNYDDYG